tara:strand:+ start:1128 stop:1337 length:210 start_codon:yes stop_codon:yes gene_type:complete
MSTEILNRTSDYTEENTPDISNKKELRKKVNIEVLKKRVFEEKKREKFQNRVLIVMFCFSIALLGYIIV